MGGKKQWERGKDWKWWKIAWSDLTAYSFPIKFHFLHWRGISVLGLDAKLRLPPILNLTSSKDVGTHTHLARATLGNSYQGDNVVAEILDSNPGSATRGFSDTILGLSFFMYKLAVITEHLFWAVLRMKQSNACRSMQHCAWEAIWGATGWVSDISEG